MASPKTLTVIGPNGHRAEAGLGSGHRHRAGRRDRPRHALLSPDAAQRVRPLRPLPRWEGRGHHRHHRPLSDGWHRPLDILPSPRRHPRRVNATARAIFFPHCRPAVTEAPLSKRGFLCVGSVARTARWPKTFFFVFALLLLLSVANRRQPIATESRWAAAPTPEAGRLRRL